MTNIKVLNLYAGIGGNRKLWDNCEVTAVEIDNEIANEYKRFFPEDAVVVGDAHNYLEKNYDKFDYIWASPPCSTHGQYRYNVGYRAKGYKAVMPDMNLYSEIIFLQYYFKGKWVVENTRPYYDPLIPPTVILQRHLFWSNYDIKLKKFGAKMIRSKNKISDYENTGFDITQSKIKNKRQVLRNAIDSDIGFHVFNEAWT